MKAKQQLHRLKHQQQKQQLIEARRDSGCALTSAFANLWGLDSQIKLLGFVASMCFTLSKTGIR